MVFYCNPKDTKDIKEKTPSASRTHQRQGRLQAISKTIFPVTLSEAKGLKQLKSKILRCAQNDTFERIEVLK
jgi:hypothetical protein